MALKLKNYTSNVPVFKTVARIEARLAAAGVSTINKEYGPEGGLAALHFGIRLPESPQTVKIRLPVNVLAVETALLREVKRPRKGTSDRLKEQAARTAWKLMQDWTEVQLSLIQLEQAEWMQVFLPYLWDGRQDFYHALAASKYRALAQYTGDAAHEPGPRCPV